MKQNNPDKKFQKKKKKLEKEIVRKIFFEKKGKKSPLAPRGALEVAVDVVKERREGVLEALAVVRGGLRLNELVLVVDEPLLVDQHEREHGPS